MSLISYKRGQGSIVLRVKIRDSSQTDGRGLTGLTSASTGLRISAIADVEATTVSYLAAGSTIDTIATLGTYAAPTAGHCRFKEVDSTSHPGVYEIQLADARYAVTSAKSLLVSIVGAANAVQTDAVLPLVDLDPYTAKVTLDPAGTLGTLRPLDTVPDASLTWGDAGYAAIAQAVGQWTLSGTTLTLKSPTGTVLRTLTLDNPAAPTARS